MGDQPTQNKQQSSNSDNARFWQNSDIGNSSQSSQKRKHDQQEDEPPSYPRTIKKAMQAIESFKKEVSVLRGNYRGGYAGAGRGRGSRRGGRGGAVRAPAYYPIYAMDTQVAPPTIKMIETPAAGLELSYPAGSLEFAAYSAQGVVNTSLYTTVQKGKGTWNNVTSVSITLTEDAMTQDGVREVETPLRVKLSPTFLEVDSMRGKITHGSSITYLNKNKEAFSREYLKLISKMLPGDIVKVTPQETKKSKTGNTYQLWQVDRLKRVSTLQNASQSKDWLALPVNGALTVTAQAKSSARIPAMYHGQYEESELRSVHVWSTAGTSCLLNNKANYIPNAGSKLVVVDVGEDTVQPVLAPYRPFTSVGASSLAPSECSEGEISHDQEIALLDDNFDFDAQPQMAYNSPLDINKSLSTLTLASDKQEVAKSPVKVGNGALKRTTQPTQNKKKQTSTQKKDKAKEASGTSMEQ